MLFESKRYLRFIEKNFVHTSLDGEEKAESIIIAKVCFETLIPSVSVLLAVLSFGYRNLWGISMVMTIIVAISIPFVMNWLGFARLAFYALGSSLLLTCTISVFDKGFYYETYVLFFVLMAGLLVSFNKKKYQVDFILFMILAYAGLCLVLFLYDSSLFFETHTNKEKEYPWLRVMVLFVMLFSMVLLVYYVKEQIFNKKEVATVSVDLPSIHILNSNSPYSNIESKEPAKTFSFNTRNDKGELVNTVIPMKQILFTEVSGNSLTIHRVDGKQFQLTGNNSLKEFLKKMNDDGSELFPFLKISADTAINLSLKDEANAAIQLIPSNKILVYFGKRFIVSDKRYPVLKGQL